MAKLPVEIAAHRGESADAPENTMAAFRLAWQRRVDAIELDVHLSQDGRLIVCHDADTQRTAGVKKVIRESTWAELKSLDVGQWKGPQFARETIPCLDDVLAELPIGVRCFIEVKVGPEAIPSLVNVVKGSGKPSVQFVVISFHASTVAAAKEQLPESKAYLLASFKQETPGGQWTLGLDDLVTDARQIRADGLGISVEGPIDELFVQRVRDAGLELHVWTVDNEVTARRLVQLGVNGINSNRAAWLKRRLTGN